MLKKLTIHSLFILTFLAFANVANASDSKTKVRFDIKKEDVGKVIIRDRKIWLELTLEASDKINRISNANLKAQIDAYLEDSNFLSMRPIIKVDEGTLSTLYSANSSDEILQKAIQIQNYIASKHQKVPPPKRKSFSGNR
ncbi:MAG: hypothetical protein R3D71_04220 [Rickettsiales bacterium]